MASAHCGAAVAAALAGLGLLSPAVDVPIDAKDAAPEPLHAHRDLTELRRLIERRQEDIAKYKADIAEFQQELAPSEKAAQILEQDWSKLYSESGAADKDVDLVPDEERDLPTAVSQIRSVSQALSNISYLDQD